MITGFVLSLALTLLALVDFRRGFLFAAYPVRSLFYAFNSWQLLLLAVGLAGMAACHRRTPALSQGCSTSIGLSADARSTRHLS